jgi:hypothetical protein
MYLRCGDVSSNLSAGNKFLGAQAVWKGNVRYHLLRTTTIDRLLQPQKLCKEQVTVESMKAFWRLSLTGYLLGVANRQ